MWVGVGWIKGLKVGAKREVVRVSFGANFWCLLVVS
jgi:hypothetical protein